MAVDHQPGLAVGAELDAELSAAVSCRFKIRAERDLQLPPRDTRVLDKNEEAEEKDIKRAEALRRSR